MSSNSVAEISVGNLSSLSSTKEFKPIISDVVKTRINYGFNGTAAAINLLTTINGNFSIIETLQEKLEQLSAIVSKFATVAQGLVNATIAIEKKNIVAAIGGGLELPIAFLTSGYNLYLARGMSAGMNQMDSIISRTKKRDSNNKVLINDEGKEQYYDNFREEGWLEGFKILMKHLPKYTTEIFKNPRERSGLFPRSFFLCSTFMFLGPIVAFSINEKIGAVIRHLFGGLAGVALATDLTKEANKSQEIQNNNIKNKQSKRFSDYAISGILWVLAAIPDVLKRFDFISSKISNGTEIALCLDRLAGIFFLSGNQGTEDKAAA